MGCCATISGVPWNDDSAAFLALDFPQLTGFMQSNMLRLAGDGGDQCLKCAFVCTKVGNMRRHLIRHIMEEEALAEQLQFILETNALISGKQFTCRICRKILTHKGRNDIRLHFVNRHMS